MKPIHAPSGEKKGWWTIVPTSMRIGWTFPRSRTTIAVALPPT